MRLSFRGRRSTTAYPAAVLLAGAQAAWDVRAITGYRAANLTKTRTGTALPIGWATSTASGWNRIQSTAADSTLEGFDTEGYIIWIRHNRCTVRDCLLDMTNYAGTADSNPIWISPGSEVITGTTIEYNEVNGAGLTNVRGCVQACIYEHASGNSSGTTIRGNYLHHSRSDCIQASGAGILIEQNRVMIGGWGSLTAHCDLIQYTMGKTTGAVGTIQDNYLDLTPSDDTYGRTSAITNNTQVGVLIQRNIIGFGSDVADNGYVHPTGFGAPSVRGPVFYSIVDTTVGLEVTNNVFVYNPVGGDYMPVPRKGISSWSGNYRLSDGAELTNPGNT